MLVSRKFLPTPRMYSFSNFHFRICFQLDSLISFWSELIKWGEILLSNRVLLLLNGLLSWDYFGLPSWRMKAEDLKCQCWILYYTIVFKRKAKKRNPLFSFFYLNFSFFYFHFLSTSAITIITTFIFWKDSKESNENTKEISEEGEGMN